MINIIKKCSPLAAVLLTAGCSTMHFTQTGAEQEPVKLRTHSQWHDTTLNGIVEISYPVNLYKTCQGQPWKKVTVEFGFIAGITVFSVNAVVDAIAPGLSFVNMYAPWDVETQCAYSNNSVLQ